MFCFVCWVFVFVAFVLAAVLLLCSCFSPQAKLPEGAQASDTTAAAAKLQQQQHSKERQQAKQQTSGSAFRSPEDQGK